jgi:transcriptional regulator with PAS, ATPase and Fis domain
MDKDYDEDYDDGNDTPEIIRPAVKERRETAQYNVSYEEAETVDESVSLQEKELEMIKKSLERNKGKRKLAAKELGISERTLYRKLKQFDL